jgi:hypothetical protein
MAIVTVNGVATSFDLPQYIGNLFRVRERPNALLRLIGGLTGAIGLVQSTEFVLGVDYELAAQTQPAKLEGAAPTPSEVGTSQATNLVQIFHESVKLTYSRQGAQGTIAGLAVIPGGAQGEVNRPGTLEWQIDRKMEMIAMQANYSFLRGAYQKPVDNTTARKTRGVLTAVTTNLFDNGGTPRALTKVIFEAALRDAMQNGAFQMGAELVVFGDAVQLSALVELYRADGQLPISREVVGVSVRTIVTTWATVHLVFEPDMPAGTLFVWQPARCRVVAMPIPGKGILFAEPLAKTGSSEEHQLYGELGIDYRHEVNHIVISDLATS